MAALQSFGRLYDASGGRVAKPVRDLNKVTLSGGLIDEIEALGTALRWTSGSP